MVRQRPRVVALPEKFALSPRGTALTHRIAVDAQFAGTQVLVIDIQGSPVPVPIDARPTWLPLDAAGTRRVPRIRMRRGIDVQVDGATASLIDLSTMGAQVVSATVLKPRQRVRVVLRWNPISIRAAGTVAWALFEISKGGMPPQDPARGWSSRRPTPNRCCSSASSRPPRPPQASYQSAEPNHAAASGSLRTMVSSRAAPVEMSSDRHASQRARGARRTRAPPAADRLKSLAPAVGRRPARHRLEHGRAALQAAQVGRELLTHLVTDAVPAQIGTAARPSSTSSFVIATHRAVHAHGVARPTASNQPQRRGRPVTAPNSLPAAQRFAFGAVHLGGKRPFAHAGRVGLHDAEHRVDRARPDAEPVHAPPAVAFDEVTYG